MISGWGNVNGAYDRGHGLGRDPAFLVALQV